jgi:hypothetical protein
VWLLPREISLVPRAGRGQRPPRTAMPSLLWRCQSLDAITTLSRMFTNVKGKFSISEQQAARKNTSRKPRTARRAGKQQQDMRQPQRVAAGHLQQPVGESAQKRPLRRDRVDLGPPLSLTREPASTAQSRVRSSQSDLCTRFVLHLSGECKLPCSRRGALSGRCASPRRPKESPKRPTTCRRPLRKRCGIHTISTASQNDLRSWFCSLRPALPLDGL